MRTVRLALVATLLCTSALAAQTPSRPSAEELAAITARGTLLQEYDQASSHATDAVQALHPVAGVVRRYIARKMDGCWTVVFGRFDQEKDAFLVVYEATEGKGITDFTVKTHDPPAKDTTFIFADAKAIDLALQHTQLQKRPYNTYILPQPDGQLYVYVLPAQTVDGIYPLGGDTRFLISPDGATIVETRQLHKTILDDTPANLPPGATLSEGTHTHVVTDRPEDTDVFHVLRQTHPVPEMIVTKTGIYTVATDGSITVTK